MAEKEPFVPRSDRPDLPEPPPPDKRIGELQVRDLDVLLQHAFVRKQLAYELKHWKFEKWEHPKWEKFEKWEHPKWEKVEKWELEPVQTGFEPGPDPRQFDPRIDQLITAMTELKKEVEALKARVK
jgi:hypothetical protein